MEELKLLWLVYQLPIAYQSPNKDSEIERELKKLKKLSYSIVFFISPKKINKILKHFKNHFHERDILISREMTKIYEEKLCFLAQFFVGF